MEGFMEQIILSNTSPHPAFDFNSGTLSGACLFSSVDFDYLHDLPIISNAEVSAISSETEADNEKSLIFTHSISSLRVPN